MSPIRWQDLPPDAHCLAPKIQKRKGRPRKKWLRHEALKRGKGSKHCQICRSTDHDHCRCDQSGPPINAVLQPKLCSRRTEDAELETTLSQVSDWSCFFWMLIGIWFSNEGNTLNANSAFFGGSLMIHWQNSCYEGCELLARVCLSTIATSLTNL